MKLNQVLAQMKRNIPTNYSAITELHKMAQKPALFNGFHKVYKPLKEGDTVYPDERQIVQQVVGDVIVESANLWTAMFDLEVTKDNANQIAKADVIIGGKVLLKDIPVTSLLYFEKQLLDMRKHYEVLPTLEESEAWLQDEGAKYWRSIPTQTQRTQLTHKPIVLYDATDRHPAQTQLLQEQAIVGYWETTKQSGAIRFARKKVLLERLDVLMYAVKVAREQANMVEAPKMEVGKPIFEYLLAK